MAKVWGFAKYYHENGFETVVNVDSILLEALPKVRKDMTRIEFQDLLSKLISSVQRDSMSGINPFPDIEDYALLDNNWLSDTICLNKAIKVHLEELFLSRDRGEGDFAFNRENIGTVRQSNENNYDNRNNADLDIRLLGLFRYWNMINFFYPSKNHIEESWDKALFETIPKFMNVQTEKGYRSEIYRLTNRLKDSHTSLPPSVDRNVFGPYRPNFRMLKLGDSLVINEIRFPEENLEKFELGDIVLRVDNDDAHRLYDSLQAFTGGGNYWSNQRFVSNAVLSRTDSATIFTILRRMDTLIIQSKNRTAWDLHQQKRETKKKNQRKVLYKWLPDSIAYFDLESVNRKNFQKNYKAIKNAGTIILDLRNYPNTDVIGSLADNFVPPNSLFAYATYADARYPGMLRSHRSSNYVGHKDYFKGKIIVLVNEYTESYSEYLTMLLQANPNVKTVGNATSGADGNVSTLSFPGDVKTIYTGIGIYYPGMIPTQRVGVKIDHLVEPNFDTIRSGRDAILEKAINLAKQ